MSDPIRIGIVGGGAIAQLAHLPVLSKMRGAKLVALCDNDGPKARALAERFSIADAFTDIDEMLDFDVLDLVIVATPNHLHEAHVQRVLAAKVNVLCERPLALTAKGVEKSLASAAKQAVKLFVGNNHRFRNDVQLLSSFFHGSELGAVESFRTGAYHPRGAMTGWRTSRAEAGGGAFLEHGYALLDLALWLADFPEPSRVSAHMQRGRGAKAVEEAMLVVLETAKGQTMTFDISSTYVGSQERWWFEAHAARGSARLSPLRVQKEMNGRIVDVSPTGGQARESAFLQSYRSEHAHVLAVLQGEQKYEAPDDQVVLARTLEAIYKSAEEGREVRL